MAALGGEILTSTPRDMTAAMGLAHTTNYSVQAINGDVYIEIASTAPAATSVSSSLILWANNPPNISIPSGENLYAWTFEQSGTVRLVVTETVS